MPAGESHSINHDRNWPPLKRMFDWAGSAVLSSCRRAEAGSPATWSHFDLLESITKGRNNVPKNIRRKVEIPNSRRLYCNSNCTTYSMNLSFKRLRNAWRAYVVLRWVHRIPQGPTIYTSGSWKAWLPVETTSRDGNCQIFPLEFQRGEKTLAFYGSRNAHIVSARARHLPLS